MRMKAAPPFSPVIYGNRHTLPKPTADPAVARITPILLPKFALYSFIYKITYNKRCKIKYFFLLLQKNCKQT